MSPTVGWGLMLGTLAILGMPPFGVFASEFLILTTAMSEQPWATPFLLLALAVAFAAIFVRVQPMVFGDTTAKRSRTPAGVAAGVRPSRHRADAGTLHSALSCDVVSAGGGHDRGVTHAHRGIRVSQPGSPVRVCGQVFGFSRTGRFTTRGPAPPAPCARRVAV